MISSVATTRCNIFAQNFPVSVLGLWHALWQFTEQNTCNQVTSIISFVIQVDQGSPCGGTQEPPWGTNEPCLKLYETDGPLLHGSCAPFLKLKIELTKLLAANWNTLIGLLSLAITNLWKVDLGFKYLKVNQNEMLFQKSILKIEQYYNKVCFHTTEENK